MGAIQLTDNDFSNWNPQISGNNVVWQSYDGNDWVFLHKGT